MSELSKVLRRTTLALAMAATVTLGATSGADARARIGGAHFHGGGGHWHGGGGHWHGGGGHWRGGGWRGGGDCWGCWAGAGLVGGLALGALASPYYYGYGPAYYGGYYGGCHRERRIRHTAYGTIVRNVRVCY
jgi:hypothetical protein